jgi:hypothetical protein
MSLKTLSKKMQASGRGKDSMLVHMSPREVRGLQQLARIKGGSLTTNPETGLPEAGFLEDILPMVAAGAAIYFTGGAAAAALGPAGLGLGATTAGILGGAGAGAVIGGGSAAIQGGDVGNAALMGGLTGAIGGGISGAMGGAAPVPGTDAAGAVSQTAGTSAAAANAPLAQATAVGANPIGINPATGMGIDPLATGTGAAGGAQMPMAGAPQFSQFNAGANPAYGSAPSGVSGLTGAPQAGQYAASLPPPQTPTGGTDAGNWWSKQTPMAKAGYSTLGAGLVAGLNAPPNTVGDTGEEDYTSPLQRISPDFRAQEPIQPNPYYRSRYPTYAAQGGLMDAYQAGGPVERMSQMNTALNPQGGMYPQGMIDKTQYALPTQRPTSMEVLDAGAQRTFARGGIADLGGYSDGGRMLKGPGDGMSDSIPGVIANKQPARLADGEFVVPADVVSHLGNGSTDAGAKRLYAMMDKVRAARTGKKKQAPAVNTSRFLPA